jgi:hypothetical protein
MCTALTHEGSDWQNVATAARTQLEVSLNVSFSLSNF